MLYEEKMEMTWVQENRNDMIGPRPVLVRQASVFGKSNDFPFPTARFASFYY
jgi:hypothetical protein